LRTPYLQAGLKRKLDNLLYKSGAMNNAGGELRRIPILRG
jgi:hypothetical protein